MKRTAFYGGSFDPVHSGHMTVAKSLIQQFTLDEFVFIPAFHAPHKTRSRPTSAYDRYAMLCLATQELRECIVSRIEIELSAPAYSVETLSRLNATRPAEHRFFVMGADSWMDIATWREWEKVLSLMNHIVVTRPGVEITTKHVSEDVRTRIVDLRGSSGSIISDGVGNGTIYFSDRSQVDISSTQLRRQVREGGGLWKAGIPPQVANYIEKYQIYS